MYYSWCCRVLKKGLLEWWAKADFQAQCNRLDSKGCVALDITLRGMLLIRAMVFLWIWAKAEFQAQDRLSD